MKFKTKRRWNIIAEYCIGWMIALIFLCIIRGVGTSEQGSLQFDFLPSIAIASTIAPILGLISGYGQILLEERIYKRISIQKLLTLRLVYATLFLVILILVSYIVYRVYFDTQIGLVEFALEPGSFAVYFYMLAVDFFLAVLRQVNLLLGEKKLMRFLMGAFYTPREEERIFMFLDLNTY